jgi:hypothetical protein
MRSESGDHLLASLIALAAALRGSGVEVDAENLFGKVFFALRKQLGKGE